jgi:hypothetical protein
MGNVFRFKGFGIDHVRFRPYQAGRKTQPGLIMVLPLAGVELLEDITIGRGNDKTATDSAAGWPDPLQTETTASVVCYAID